MFIDKGISGGVRLKQRQEGYKLCLTVQPGDLVLMQKPDRGWRSTYDCCKTARQWKEMGVGLAFTSVELDTSTPMGSLMLTILAAFAEFERAMIAERMKHFFAQRKRAGRPYCRNAPFGFRVVGRKGEKRYAEFPEQRTIARKIVAWRDEGWTYEQIALHLDIHKIRHPKTGGTLSPSTIYKWERAERALQAAGK